MYTNCEYIGADIADGEGVDVVIDLCEGIGDIEPESIDLIVCCSVLEHVKKPWRMAENIDRLTRSGGKIYISVPWVWRYHPYPDDYFRFSWRGIEELFENVQNLDGYGQSAAHKAPDPLESLLQLGAKSAVTDILATCLESGKSKQDTSWKCVQIKVDDYNNLKETFRKSKIFNQVTHVVAKMKAFPEFTSFSAVLFETPAFVATSTSLTLFLFILCSLTAYVTNSFPHYLGATASLNCKEENETLV